MPKNKKIKILHCGPYEVSGDTPLNQAVIKADASGASESWKRGRDYKNESGEDYHLCRCGHSQKKPYCDGTHNDVDFAGTERDNRQPYREGARIYEGGEVDLLDNEKLCAVARYCDADPSTWQCAVESDKPGYRETAIKKACNCPSGRLTVTEKDGSPIEPQLDQEISAIQDEPSGCRGPLWVKGGIEIEGADGKPYEIRNRVTLCRCGETSNMPFCDASHLRAKHMKGLDE